jgi:hypothetical protein
MSHERDRDHRSAPPAPREPRFLESEPCPDRGRRERPSLVPSEPLDPRPHPERDRSGVRPIR